MSSLFCGIPSDVLTPPCYVVDLNQPPQTRWNHILSLYIDKIHEVEKQIDSMIDQVLGSWVSSILESIVTSIMSGVTHFGFVYYGEELKGFSKLTGIPLGRLVLIQFMYECSTCCTSIVCRDPTTKTPIHIRTMDWGLDFLRDLTIDVDFQRNGQSVVKGTTWIGYVGILTGMRCEKGFSVSVNFRRAGGTFAANLKTALTRGWPIGFLLREVFERTCEYSTAVDYLAQSTLIAPCYFTICGSMKNNDPGTLITRTQNAEEKRWTLNKDGEIVQTNIDHWSSKQEEDILFSIERRTKARNWLKELPNFNEETLWHLISRRPIKNGITIYANVMCPEYDIYHTRLPHPTNDFKSNENHQFDLASEISRFSSAKNYSCVRCEKDFSLDENSDGNCIHNGDWHSQYEDCSYVKCGYALAKKLSIGSAHWSCCYSLDRNNPICKKSRPHTHLHSK